MVQGYDKDAMEAQVQKYATVREEPTDYKYSPPAGRPILKLPDACKLYQVDEPHRQSDLLAGYERRHTIPIAMMIAPVFGVVPIPDDVYRLAPEYAKNNLFCIFSRSGIQRTGDVLNWDAVVVVVQKLCVVRVNCDLSPGADKFSIKRILLWSSKTQTYQTIQDPSTPTVDPSVVPYIMDRYAAIEGIT